MGSILVTLAPAIVSPEATAVALTRLIVGHSAIDSGYLWVLLFTCCPLCWPHAKAPIRSYAFFIHHPGRGKILNIKYIRFSRHHSPIRTLYTTVLCFKMHISWKRYAGDPTMTHTRSTSRTFLPLGSVPSHAAAPDRNDQETNESADAGARWQSIQECISRCILINIRFSGLLLDI